MPYFQAPGDPSPHFLTEADVEAGFAALLPVGSTPITDEQAETMRQAYLTQNSSQPKEP